MFQNLFSSLMIFFFYSQLNVFFTPHRGGSRVFFRRGCTCLLLYINTNKPNSFFFCRIPVVLENPGHLRGGGVHPQHPPPRSAPASCIVFPCHLIMNKLPVIWLSLCYTVVSQAPSWIEIPGGWWVLSKSALWNGIKIFYNYAVPQSKHLDSVSPFCRYF